MTLVAVLAGGASRRMGEPKPLVELGGRPLISYPLAAAAAADLPAVVVAKRATPLPLLDVPVWAEPDDPQHPLLGLVTALARAGEPIVAVGCDQPWLPPALLARLAGGEPRATAPQVGGRLEPLPARYEPDTLPALREALARLAPLREALEACEPAVLDEEELRAFGDPTTIVAGVNTPQALAAARLRRP